MPCRRSRPNGNPEKSLTGGELFISSSLAINGPGASNQVIIDGGSNASVFEIGSGAIVSISGLTIQNGSSSGNGGGIVNNGILKLNNSTLVGNFANIKIDSATFADHLQGPLSARKEREAQNFLAIDD